MIEFDFTGARLSVPSWFRLGTAAVVVVVVVAEADGEDGCC